MFGAIDRVPHEWQIFLADCSSSLAFLRPMIAWLELTIADVHEYAEMMNRSISDDDERQVALRMEHDGCSPGPPFSAISISVLQWFRRMWQRISPDSILFYVSA